MSSDGNDDLTWAEPDFADVNNGETATEFNNFVKQKALSKRIGGIFLPLLRNRVFLSVTSAFVGAGALFAALEIDGFSSEQTVAPTTSTTDPAESAVTTIGAPKSLAPNRIAPVHTMFSVGKYHYELDTSFQTLDTKIDGVSNLVQADAVLYNVDGGGRRLKAGVPGSPQMYVTDVVFLQSGQSPSVFEQKYGCGLTEPGDSFRSTENSEMVACETTSQLKPGNYVLDAQVADALTPGERPMSEPMTVRLDPLGF